MSFGQISDQSSEIGRLHLKAKAALKVGLGSCPGERDVLLDTLVLHHLATREEHDHGNLDSQKNIGIALASPADMSAFRMRIIACMLSPLKRRSRSMRRTRENGEDTEGSGLVGIHLMAILTASE